VATSPVAAALPYLIGICHRRCGAVITAGTISAKQNVDAHGAHIRYKQKSPEVKLRGIQTFK